ncbi:MAG: glycosyltransferase family 39 protein, partial [Candidatus Moraniibacteriota bacterium]
MRIFLVILLFFLAFGWLVLLLAATGLLYFGMVILSILAGIVLTWLFLPYISRNIDMKTSKIFWLVVLISLFASLAACHFATPTVFGGRDQGSIGTAAIYLSQNHNLKIDLPIASDLFQKYGPGKSLNFPGFDYAADGSLFSRFPVGYTAFLAGAYELFGLKGIQYANFAALFFFLVIFWLILKEVFDEKISFLGFLLAATFFPFLWFAKYALTETYMLFLVSAGIYFLITCRRPTSTNLDVGRLQIALAAFALSALVRIEGIIFFFLAAIYVVLLERKKIITLSKKFKKYLLVSALVLLGLYVYLNFPDLVDSSKNLVKAFLPNSAKESAPSANLYSYLARIFFNYNIAVYVVIGLVGIAWLAKNIRKNWPKPEFLVLFITFPAFLYLLSPMITLDEPWFLRRFVFAVFPALIFYTVYILQKFFRHKIF